MQQAVDESARGAAPGSEFPEAGEKGPLDESTAKILEELSQTMNRAGGQARNWEDMRSDLVEETLGRGSFREGPITGNPAEGNEVRVSLGGREMAAGEVYDRPVEVSDDLAAYERLRGEAQPIAEILRRNLYPNRELVPESLRLRAGGVLDGNRLALAGFSSTVFKRFRNVEKADRRGRPVLVIACDGSGSLNHLQMRMLKVLTAAWLNSTVGSEIQVLAALYHSGSIRPGVGGPLVQWIYHPQKTPAIGRAEAARTLVSLPSTGTGVQSDALSLAFIMNEARRLAKRSSIYLTLLSDTAWNKSFQTPLTGREEVMQLFQDLKTERDDKLHTVLVALGAGTPTGFETLLDKVIVVSPQELANYTSVAEHIGLYVANCLRQRRGARTL